MFKSDGPFDTLIKQVTLSIPVDSEVLKFDIVENMGLGIWFTDTELPTIILLFDSEKEAIDCMQGFKRAKLKCKMKVVEGGKDGKGLQ